MSVSPGRQSLAPTGAEDDGDSGTKSVPAMLRLVKDCLVRHTTCVNDAVSAVADKDALSSVMGTLELGKIPKAKRDILIGQLSETKKVLENIVLIDPDLGPATAAAVQKELHALIRKSLAERPTPSKVQAAVKILLEHIKEVCQTPLEMSIEKEINRARGLANQCLILTTGARTGQPWKKDQAVQTFDKDVLFLIDRVSAMKSSRALLHEAKEIINDLRSKKTLIEQISDKETSDKILKLEQMISHNCQSINALEKEVQAHFNDGAQILSGDRATKTLSIPADVIEKSRGAWVRSELPAWYKLRVDRLWILIPWLNRIINDYDALRGEYYKPPDNEQANTEVPEILREEWIKANKSLAETLRQILGTLLYGQLTCTFSYGANSTKTAKCAEDDGVGLVFALMTLSSPNSSNYRDSIDRQIHGCAQLCASGNPSDFVKQARITLQEAIRLNLPVKWHVAKSIIDLLAQRHSLYSRDLRLPREDCADTEDCAPDFDALLTKISDINETIKHGFGDTWWSQGNAQALNAQVKAKGTVGNLHEWCRYGMDCNLRESGMCKRSHDPHHHPLTKADKGKGKGKGKSKGKGKGATNSTQPAKRCAKIGCSDTAGQYGELCIACFKTAKQEGGYKNRHGKQIEVSSNKNSDRQAERKLAKRSANATASSAKAKTTEQQDEDMDLNPEVKGVYLTFDQFNLLRKNGNSPVITNNTTDTNKVSVTGEVLGRQLRGPASYKRRIVSNFLDDNPNINVPINIIVQKFKGYLNST